MCGRFTLKTSPARIKEMFRLQRNESSLCIEAVS